MNRRLFLFSSLLISTNLTAKHSLSKKVQASKKTSFQNVHANIWVLHGVSASPFAKQLGLVNNPSFIETKNGLIVIDPGGSYTLGQYILNEIQKVTPKPILALFNTHGHNDHFFANAAFQEAYPYLVIYAHENLKDAAIQLYGGRYKIRGYTFNKAKTVVFPTHTLKGGETLTIDGEELEIKHPKKAHTNNDITLSHLNSKSIFMGDLLMSQTLANFGLNSSIQGNIRFLEEVNKEKPYDYYIPGHGPSGKYKAVFIPYLHYLSIIEDEIKHAYKNELPMYALSEVEDKILLRLSWEENITFANAFVSRYMHHIYSELEERQIF